MAQFTDALEVEVEQAPSSYFDLSNTVRLDSPCGTIQPVCVKEISPTDSFDLDIAALVKTYPLKSPLMGTFRVKTDVFFTPIRLYVPEARENNFRNFNEVRLPVFSVSLDTRHERMALAQYFGVSRGVDYIPNMLQQKYENLSATLILSYWESYLNFYINQNESYCPIWYFDGRDDEDPNTNRIAWVSVQAFSSWIDNVKKSFTFTDLRLLDLDQLLGHFWHSDLPGTWGDFVHGDMELHDIDDNPLTAYALLGLGLHTYKRDLFNCRVGSQASQNVLGLSSLDAFVQVDAQRKFSVNSLRVANKAQKFLDRSSLLRGTRYADFISSMFVTDVKPNLDIPTLLGSSSSYMSFDDVITTSATAGEPAASLVGKGLGFNSSRLHKLYFDDYGYLTVYLSIVPVVDYTYGIDKIHSKRFFNELFNPVFDNLAPVDVPVKEWLIPKDLNDYYTDMAFYDSSCGKLPCWYEYRTGINRVLGNFAEPLSLSYWANVRFMDIRKDDGSIDKVRALTTYVIPSAWNNAFADASPLARNFLVQLKFGIVAKRQISKQLPKL